jgi:hypothetical protein
VQDAKAAAILAHVSQVRASAEQPGSEAPLHGRVLAHYAGSHEHYVTGPA